MARISVVSGLGNQLGHFGLEAGNLSLHAMTKRPITAPSGPKKPRTFATGGGNATASGVNFQQSVGAVAGVWMVSEQPIDQRFGLGAAKAISIQFETEAPLDDVLVGTSDHGFLAMQAKNSLSSSKALTSEYGKTVGQIVRQWRLCRDGLGQKGWDRPLDPGRDRLVIVVGPDSPATTRQHLARGLEARRQVGTPILTRAEKKALEDFDACLRAAWAGFTTDILTEAEIQAISRLTYVFTIDPAGADRAALAGALAPALLNPSDGPATLQLLERVNGDLMSARGGVDIPGLRRDLLGRGAKLATRPDYRADIAALKAYTAQVEVTLSAYEVIEADVGQPIGIERRCQADVTAAALSGPLLLVGEPGAGKSAVMNNLTRTLKARGHDVVELAVDRFSIQSLEGLTADLNLQHPLVDVLRAWDGPDDGFLVIDALDASRGGPSEAAFKRLIEAIMEEAGRWTVVASIRTFDLRMGQTFRGLFNGTPPVAGLSDTAFSGVRHIHVPAWTPEEFDELKARSPKLAAIFAPGSDKLRDLALVPFNTRLLADLIAAGAVSEDFNRIDSQIALMNLYWERRVESRGLPAEVCLRRVVAAMVARRSLRARKLDVAQQDPLMLQGLIGDGVLAEIDDRRSVQFRHHLLFDYAASRVFLDADAIVSGQASFPKADGLGLVLAPAMAFLLKGLWSADQDHSKFWAAVSHLLGSDDCDPIVRSIVARMAAELPVDPDDAAPLAQRIVQADPPALAALHHIAGAFAIRLEDEPSAPLSPWVQLARAMGTAPSTAPGVLRLFGFLLIDRTTDPAQRADLGGAMRALLSFGFTQDEARTIAVPAIGFVAETFSTDPDASRALLVQVFDPSRFDRFGPQEVPMLTRKIAPIAEADPVFAADIYREVYSRAVYDTRKTSMGSGQILNMSSNARQDYDLSRYMLGEYLPTFLGHSPVEAARAVIGAMEGYVERAHRIPETMLGEEVAGPEGTVQLQPDLSHIWAHEVDPRFAQDGEALLPKFIAFLRTGPEAEVLEAVRYAIEHNRLAVVWSRLFLAAAQRGGALAALVEPYARREKFLLMPDTKKDAVDLVAADYDRRSLEERAALETWALGLGFEAYTEPAIAKDMFLKRLFGAIGLERLATPEARAFHEADPPGPDNNRRLNVMTVERMALDDYRWMDDEAKAEPNNARVMAAIAHAISTLHLELNDTAPPASLQVAVDALKGLKAEIDAGAVSDKILRQRADGILAQGVYKLVRSEWVSETTAADIIDWLAGLIEWAAMCSSPEVEAGTEAEFEQFSSWSPSARIHTAEACLDLCLAYPDIYPRLSSLIDTLLNDRHPAVRLQACHHLNRIWDLDRAGFWRRASAIIATEENRSVLSSFVVNLLANIFLPVASNEVADLTLPLLDRLPASDPRNAQIRLHLVQMAALLSFQYDHADAERRIDVWAKAPVDHADEVVHIIHWQRDLLTAGLRGEDGSRPEDRARALSFLSQAVNGASDEFAGFGDLNNLSEMQIERAQRAARIIDSACQQLYFASGAFKNLNSQSAVAPITDAGLRTFFSETAPLLRRIGEHASAHTIYYLVQLLDHLVEIDPPAVFDLIVHALLQGGRDGGYQYESMGADLIVKLIGEYLADYKEIFEVAERRQALIDCLETFVTAGWPSVRRLLYRLPELIQ